MARIRLNPPQTTIFSTTLGVRVTDLNYGNHLGHMELVGLLHQARVEFLSSLGMTELNIEGRVLMVVDLAVSYRSQAFVGQVLTIDIGLDFEGSRGIELTYSVKNSGNGILVALARTGVLFADAQEGKVVQVPQCLRALVDGRTV